MMEFETPYDQYQAKGYSAKQTFLTIFGGTIGIGLVGIAAYVVVKFLSALDAETMEALALIFFAIVFLLFGVGGALTIVTIFRYVQKPGRQLPGILGKLEDKLEGR